MDPWKDPRTWIAIGGASIGGCGFVFAIVSHLWNRRESRNDILSKVLRPMTKCLQDLMIANNARQKREQLMFSYPNADKPDVVEHVNQLFDRYSESIDGSSKSFHEAQTEFAATSFRFPRSLAKAIKSGQETLSEVGRLVNDGIHHKAELEFAKYRDDHGRIVKMARGWQVAGPLELLKRDKKKGEDESDAKDFEFDLTPAELNRLLELFHKRATTQSQNTFVVHPPKKILDNPGILESDTIIEELSDSVFMVVFQDGTTAMLGLHELVAFNYQLCMVRVGVEEAYGRIREEDGVHQVSVTLNLCMRELMRPAMVQLLLSKTEFSDRPSDGAADSQIA